MDCPRITSLLVLISIGAASAAGAQTRVDCLSPQPASVGIAFGRSSPYLELASGAVDVEPDSSVSVRSGVQFAGRVDAPVVGPVRVRLEGATARWDLRRIRYDTDAGFRVISETSLEHMTARHLVALVGLRTGRAPVCAHVSAGGGVYSIGFQGTPVRRAGFALAAGMEIPTGPRGVVQLDATLHLIGTRDAPPIASTTVPVLSLLAGWAYRF
jgi:hypothetical protein